MRSKLEVELLHADDSRADEEIARLLERCPTSFAQQTTAWRDVLTGVDRDEPLFLGCRLGGELAGVLPAYRFEGPFGAVLNSVPGAGPLGGVVCDPAREAEAVYRALVDAYLELARDRDCAAASLITNPFAPDLELYRSLRAPDCVLRNTCQVLDLAEGLDGEGWPVAASRNLRRNLRRALGGELVVDEEQSPRNLAEWYAIHAERHREIGARPLPEPLFTGALEYMVPAGKARFFFVRLADSGEMVAGGFYLHHGRVMDALMPSMRSSHADRNPNAFLALHSMRWARREGLRLYNWQASPPAGGVRRYKLQWGSRDVEYAYLTWITGEIEPIVGASPRALREGYPWHFVLPFDRIGGTAPLRGESRRSDAWQRAESAR